MTDPFGFDGPVEIIAHRGYSARAPENTTVALLRALDAGATAVEFDLHTTRDGVPVLLHDETLDRTTDAVGSIASTEAADLAGVDAGSWFHEDFAGEAVATLSGALAAMGTRVTRVYAELKGVAGREHVEAVVRAVVDAGVLDRTVFISMDWGLLDAVRDAERSALLGPIVEHADRIDAAFARVSGDPRALLDFDARILLGEPGLCLRAREAGIPLAVWTVDDPDDAERLLGMGVRRITTNQVERLLGWAERHAP